MVAKKEDGLLYVSSQEILKVWREGKGSQFERAALIADLTRINTLSMIMEAGSGHIGSSFSAIDITTWIYLYHLKSLNKSTDDESKGIYFSSKGHDVPSLYALLIGLGHLDLSLLHKLRRLGGLPGHPDIHTPGMHANTGSLGMGISKAKGLAEANRLKGISEPIFVLTGDGELQEGQIWESLGGAVQRKLGSITIIVDHNKIQSDTWVSKVNDLGNLEDKFKAFGWRVQRCNGHDLLSVHACLQKLAYESDIPGVLIADTIKGKGVSFMEAFVQDGEFYPYHSGAPSLEEYTKAIDELIKKCNEQAFKISLPSFSFSSSPLILRNKTTFKSLVDSWSDNLCSLARADSRLVVLDGDLVKDTGAFRFKDQFSDRFIECGIAEQDMVSIASGLALKGFVPVVHSFACFLSGRPHEQFINNSTEMTKIIYCGSLAGLIPGGPGHSHQAVTDAASFSIAHNLLVVEPCHEKEMGALLNACLYSHLGSAYFRLTTPAVDLPFEWPCSYLDTDSALIGRGTWIQEGNEIVIVVAGPVLLKEAYLASQSLKNNKIGIISMPWFNIVDEAWWKFVLAKTRVIVTIENHHLTGGMGQFLLAKTAELGWNGLIRRLGVNSIPKCGQNEEVLHAHHLDAAGIYNFILKVLEEKNKLDSAPNNR